MTIDQLKGSRTGCYVGTFTNDYEVTQRDIYDLHPYASTGSGRSILANRVSWFYDLKGPSLVVDTACSSSMYAFHLACQSIRLGESRMALVGGTNAIISPAVLRTLASMRFLSPTGRCHSYDQSADGYARGEGVGMLLLKRLSDAIASGDTVRAVIRASGLNQDGNTPGLTVPSATAQAALIRQCYEEAGLSMDETVYFEGHGTGTLLGDPIELQALGATFGLSRSSADLLHVGSVKANIGHQEGGAGVAGLIRAILALEKGVLPPTAELTTPNTAFRLDDWKIALPQEATPWPRGKRRRISVNCFGFGGANAHVILDDARSYMLEKRLVGYHNTAVLDTTYDDLDADSAFESALATPDASWHSQELMPRPGTYLFAFSGFDQDAVGRILPRFITVLQGHCQQSAFCDKDPTAFMSNLAFTLAERRTVFSHRLAFCASSIPGLVAQLEAAQISKTRKISRKESVAFVFTGQGAQYAGMSKGLLSYEVFRESLDQSQGMLASHGCEWDLIEEILRDNITTQIDSPSVSQPICTAIQIAQVDLLASWGVLPKATVGHSSGEIAAAYASNKLSHADAICIAYYRGIFAAQVVSRQDRKRGGMLAVGLGVEEVSSYLNSQDSVWAEKQAVVVACVNSPFSVTLSGDLEAITEIEAKLNAKDVFARQLKTHNTAYHSPHMEMIASDYRSSIECILSPASRPNDIPMFSSVTGNLVASSADLNASYWVSNMLQTVKFSQALNSMLHYSPGTRKRRRVTLNHSAMLELGPSSTLKGPVHQLLQTLDARLAASSSYTSMLKRGVDDETSALTAMAQLWASGTPIDFAAINRRLYQEHPPQVSSDLPSYPWNDCGKMWHESTGNHQATNHPRTDLLGYLASWRNMNAPTWRNMIRISETPWLADHKIHTAVIYPGSSMIVMALEAAQKLAAGRRAVQGYQFRDIAFLKTLVLPPDGSKVETQLHVWASREGTRTQDSSWFEFSFVSLNEQQQWNEHCHGYFKIAYDTPATEVDAGLQQTSDWTEKRLIFDALVERLHNQIPKRTLYSTLRRAAMMYGPTFQAIETLYTGSGETHGVVAVPDTASVMPHGFEHPHLIHPTTLDGIMQISFGTMLRPDGGETPAAQVPVNIGKLYIAANLPSGVGAEFRGYAMSSRRNATETICQIVISDNDCSEPKVVFEDFVVMAMAQGVTGHSPGGLTRRKCAQLEWVRDIHYIVPEKRGLETSEKLRFTHERKDPAVSTAIQSSLNVLRSGTGLSKHLQNLLEWAEREFSDLSLSEKALTQFPEQFETLFSHGKNVASAVTKDVLAAVLGTTELDESLHDNTVIDGWLENARLYNPGLSLLLLGDGTPSSAACQVAKKHLSRAKHPDGFAKCVLTELDGDQLSSTQQSLEASDIRPRYAAFDPTTLESLDGIADQRFDLIIGPPCIASTEATLANIGNMLSPKGTLILTGPQRYSTEMTFFLGLSEVWWSSVMQTGDRRDPVPMDQRHWKTILSNAGLEQRVLPCLEGGRMTLFATPQQRPHEKLAKTFAGQHVVLILPHEKAKPDAVVFEQMLKKCLASTGCSVTISHFGDCDTHTGSVVICLAELSGELIASMSETTFASLQALLNSTSALVWLTRGAVQFDGRTEDTGVGQSVATGFFRTIRSEFTRAVHVHVDISLETDLTKRRTAEILLEGIVNEIFPVLIDGMSKNASHDRELVIDGEHILVPRVLWNASFNKELAAPSKKFTFTREPLYQANRALRLVVETPGHLDSLRWVDDDAQPLDRELAAGECLIKIKAWSLNFMVCSFLKPLTGIELMSSVNRMSWLPWARSQQDLSGSSSPVKSCAVAQLAPVQSQVCVW
jgi:acyl transferase domain-containing protein